MNPAKRQRAVAPGDGTGRGEAGASPARNGMDFNDLLLGRPPRIAEGARRQRR